MVSICSPCLFGNGVLRQYCSITRSSVSEALPWPPAIPYSAGSFSSFLLVDVPYNNPRVDILKVVDKEIVDMPLFFLWKTQRNVTSGSV